MKSVLLNAYTELSYAAREREKIKKKNECHNYLDVRVKEGKKERKKIAK